MSASDHLSQSHQRWTLPLVESPFIRLFSLPLDILQFPPLHSYENVIIGIPVDCRALEKRVQWRYTKLFISTNLQTVKLLRQ